MNDHQSKLSENTDNTRLALSALDIIDGLFWLDNSGDILQFHSSRDKIQEAFNTGEAFVKGLPVAIHKKFRHHINEIPPNESFDLLTSLSTDPSGLMYLCRVQKSKNEQEEYSYIVQLTYTASLNERLAESQGLFQVIERSLNEIYVFDPVDLKFQFVNNGATSNLGYTLEEMLELSPLDIKPDYNESAFRLLLDKIRKLPSQRLSFETFHRRKDGTTYDVDVRLQLMPYLDREVFLAVINDINEQNKNKKRLIQLTERLEEEVALRTTELQHVNEELKAFSYSVSHDLRAPLRAISGFTSLMEESISDKEYDNLDRYMDVVQSNVSQLGQLLEDLLTYSRTGFVKLDLRETDMQEMVKEAITKVMPPHLTDKVKTKVKLGPCDKLHVDSNLFQRAIENLISNAIKFSQHQSKPVISIKGIEDEENYILVIKDNGVGFNEKYSHKLFDLFQRLHSEKEYEGSGFGLALVKRIITKHNGEITALSTEGNGAEFKITLPKILS